MARRLSKHTNPWNIPAGVIKTLEADPKNHCCLYWIRSPHEVDIWTQGYVGITNNPRRRFSEHKSLVSNHCSSLYKDGMVKVDTIFEVLFVANREFCLSTENTLRVGRNTGWNLAIGGEATNITHGRTGTNVFEVYRSYKGKAFRSKLPFEWGEDLEGFVTWFNKVNPKEKPMYKVDRLLGYTVDNLKVGSKKEALLSNSKTIFYEGKDRLISEVALMVGITVPALHTRLSSGRSVAESVKPKLDTIIYKGVLISKDVFKSIENPYTEDFSMYKDKIISLAHERLNAETIADVLKIPLLHVNTLMPKIISEATGKTLNGIQLTGYKGKMVPISIQNRMTQKSMDKLITLLDAGYLDKDVAKILNEDIHYISYWRVNCGWFDNKEVGRPVIRYDGSVFKMKGRRTLDISVINEIKTLKLKGQSDTVIADTLGFCRTTISKWNVNLRWDKKYLVGKRIVVKGKVVLIKGKTILDQDLANKIIDLKYKGLGHGKIAEVLNCTRHSICNWLKMMEV